MAGSDRVSASVHLASGVVLQAGAPQILNGNASLLEKRQTYCVDALFCDSQCLSHRVDAIERSSVIDYTMRFQACDSLALVCLQ